MLGMMQNSCQVDPSQEEGPLGVFESIQVPRHIPLTLGQEQARYEGFPHPFHSSAFHRKG